MKQLKGMIIRDAYVDDDQLTLTFDFGRLTLSDCAQNCCENRWMSTDDDVRSLIGSRFVCYEVKDGPDEWEGANDEVHETQFLEIQTDKGFITLVTHNEHNGYYGGFSIEEQWSES
jgi:hypothetical protein